MKVRGKILVLLSVIYEAVSQSLFQSTINLDSGTSFLETDINARIQHLQEDTGLKLDPNDVKFAVLSNKPGGLDEQMEGYTFILMHGWSQNANTCPWYIPLTELLLKQNPDSQVIQVDYGPLVAGEYEIAVRSSEVIGLIIARLLRKLQRAGVLLDNIVLIGHSFGAQIAGRIGNIYRSLLYGQISRIIAIDPASPIFIDGPDDKRLNKYDALHVIVIHSDIKNFGFPRNCGTIDFYPNGGKDQPGCSISSGQDVTMAEIKEAIWCSHRKGMNIFMAALKSPKDFLASYCESYEDFLSHKCDNDICVSMGDWKTNAMGSYYLKFDVDVSTIN